MNISFTIGVDADDLDTGRFDALGEGMTRRFIRSGENIRPDGSVFISPDDKLMFTSRIRNAVSLTRELEIRVNELTQKIENLRNIENFLVYINIAAYHQDEQHIDVSLSGGLIKTLNDHKISVDISIYRYCPW